MEKISQWITPNHNETLIEFLERNKNKEVSKEALKNIYYGYKRKHKKNVTNTIIRK
jgi:hypothetical protein